MFTSDRLIAGLQPTIVYSVYSVSAVCTHNPGPVLTVAEAGIGEAASYWICFASRSSRWLCFSREGECCTNNLCLDLTVLLVNQFIFFFKKGQTGYIQEKLRAEQSFKKVEMVFISHQAEVTFPLDCPNRPYQGRVGLGHGSLDVLGAL